MGATPLFIAGTISVAKILVDNKADINARSYSNETPLHWAVQLQTVSKEFVKYLLDNGAAVNATDNSGTTPLDVAKSSEIRNLLIKYGGKKTNDLSKKKTNETKATVSSPINTVEATKLLIAEMNKGTEVRTNGLIEKYLNAGADVNALDKSKHSLLCYAAWENDNELIKFLVSKGAKVDIRDKDGWTPLCYAAYYNNAQTTLLLIENKADINSKGWNRTPLMLAANQNALEAAKILINKEANLEVTDDRGWTALHWAVDYNRKDMVDLLISYKANINAKTLKGQTPLDFAWSDEIKSILLKNHAKSGKQ